VTAAADLAAAGFTASNDGVLRIPNAGVELVPAGGLFYEVRITGENGSLITIVTHKAGIKVKEMAPREAREASSENGRIARES